MPVKNDDRKSGNFIVNDSCGGTMNNNPCCHYSIQMQGMKFLMLLIRAETVRKPEYENSPCVIARL